jgi:O-antigen ligase
VFRLLAAPLIVFQLLLILRTGSRGGLLALLAVLFIVWIRLSLLKKVLGVVVALVLALGLLTFLPETIKARYQSWSTQPTEPSEGGVQEAEMSAAVRLELFKESLRVSLSHPLLGAGLGQFMYAANEEREGRGERAMWKGAHNSYTQVSSEIGIPALLIYCALIAHATRSSYRVSRRGSEELRPLGLCVFAMTVGFAITAFFLNLPYFVYVPTLAVLATAFDDFVPPPGSVRQAAGQPPGVFGLNLPAAAPLPAASRGTEWQSSAGGRGQARPPRPGPVKR